MKKKNTIRYDTYDLWDGSCETNDTYDFMNYAKTRVIQKYCTHNTMNMVRADKKNATHSRR